MYKKILLWSVISIALFFMFFLIINLIDIGEQEMLFTEDDLHKNVSLEADNAFFILLAFNEPDSVDVLSEGSVEFYKQIAIKSSRSEENANLIYDRMDANSLYFSDHLNYHQIIKNCGTISFKIKGILKQKTQFEKCIKKYNIPLERLEKAIGMEKIEDFNPDLFKFFRTVSFKLRTFTQLYLHKAFYNAAVSKWKSDGIEILKVVDFHYRWMKGAGSNWRIALVSYTDSAYYWSKIIDLKNIPEPVLDKTIEVFSRYKKSGFYLKNDIITNYLRDVNFIQTESVKDLLTGSVTNLPKVSFLMLQRNRLHSYINTYYREMVAALNVPYYEKKQYKYSTRTESLFWWLVNPGGKYYFDNNVLRGGPFYLGARAVTMTDLVILSAMLHKEKVPRNKVSSWLLSKAKQGFIDPCTGKPYLWNERDSRIYSEFNAWFKEFRDWTYLSVSYMKDWE